MPARAALIPPGSLGRVVVPRTAVRMEEQANVTRVFRWEGSEASVPADLLWKFRRERGIRRRPPRPQGGQRRRALSIPAALALAAIAMSSGFDLFFALSRQVLPEHLLKPADDL